MKLRKRIAAFGAAMVMAVSMMSIGASADEYTVNWQTLYYGVGVPSYLCNTLSSATVKARTNGSTFNVNISINKTGNAYVHAYGYGANNSQNIYSSGSYQIYYSSSVLSKGQYAYFELSLKSYTSSSITASGNVSN